MQRKVGRQLMKAEHIAKVIVGPHDPDGHYDADPFRLIELRNHKWNSLLNDQERGEFLSMAKAVMRYLAQEGILIR